MKLILIKSIKHCMWVTNIYDDVYAKEQYESGDLDFFYNVITIKKNVWQRLTKRRSCILCSTIKQLHQQYIPERILEIYEFFVSMEICDSDIHPSCRTEWCAILVRGPQRTVRILLHSEIRPLNEVEYVETTVSGKEKVF